MIGPVVQAPRSRHALVGFRRGGRHEGSVQTEGRDTSAGDINDDRTIAGIHIHVDGNRYGLELSTGL